MRVLYRPEFWKDIEETMIYLTREASEKLAVHWQHSLKNCVDRIIENPGRGHFRRDLRPEGIRALAARPFLKHLVFYRWSDANGELEFYRVRHGAMNLPTLFDVRED